MVAQLRDVITVYSKPDLTKFGQELKLLIAVKGVL